MPIFFPFKSSTRRISGRAITANVITFIELAIITAILVGLAVAVLVIINTIVTNRANEINSNNGKIP